MHGRDEQLRGKMVRNARSLALASVRAAAGRRVSELPGAVADARHARSVAAAISDGLRAVLGPS
eukprot:9413186-Pyramimonas_sp.AAC.1